MAEYRRKKREQAQLLAQQLQHSTQQQEVDAQLQSQEAREHSPGQPVPCIIEDSLVQHHQEQPQEPSQQERPSTSTALTAIHRKREYQRKYMNEYRKKKREQAHQEQPQEPSQRERPSTSSALTAIHRKREYQRKYMNEYRKKKREQAHQEQPQEPSQQERPSTLTAIQRTREYQRKYMNEYRKKKREQAQRLPQQQHPIQQHQYPIHKQLQHSTQQQELQVHQAQQQQHAGTAEFPMLPSNEFLMPPSNDDEQVDTNDKQTSTYILPKDDVIIKTEASPSPLIDEKDISTTNGLEGSVNYVIGHIQAHSNSSSLPTADELDEDIKPTIIVNNGEELIIEKKNGATDHHHPSSSVPCKRNCPNSPLPDIDTLEEAMRYLKALENYVMLKENFRAIGLITQLEDAIKKTPKQ